VLPHYIWSSWSISTCSSNSKSGETRKTTTQTQCLCQWNTRQGRQERLQHKHSAYTNDIHARGDKKDYNTNTVRMSMIFTSGETRKTTTQTQCVYQWYSRQERQEKLQHKYSAYINNIHVRRDRKNYNTNTVRISMIFTSAETIKTTTQIQCVWQWYLRHGRQERLQHKYSAYVNDIHVRGDKKDYNTNTVRISMIFTPVETRKTTTQKQCVYQWYLRQGGQWRLQHKHSAYVNDIHVIWRQNDYNTDTVRMSMIFTSGENRITTTQTQCVWHNIHVRGDKKGYNTNSAYVNVIYVRWNRKTTTQTVPISMIFASGETRKITTQIQYVCQWYSRQTTLVP